MRFQKVKKKQCWFRELEMSEIVTQVSSAINGLKQEFNVIAHNLANVSTVGYKRRYNQFSKTLMEQGAGSGEQLPEDSNVTQMFDFSQGPLVETGRPLDFALCGKGFFQIETADGPLYTRNGMFRLNKDMQIVNMAGQIVLGDSGPIVIPPNVGLDQISVSKDGNVSAAGFPVGKFKLVNFKQEDEQKLTPVGGNCYSAPDDLKPQALDNLFVEQGVQESSNVDMVEELVDMIMVSRLYEANMKFVSVKRDSSKSLIGVAMG